MADAQLASPVVTRPYPCFITYYWRAALAGTLLLPLPDPALDTDSLNQLRALIGRVLASR